MAETCTSIKLVRDFRIKRTETSDLLQTARDTPELKHTTVFNDVQSLSHNEITVKTTSKHKNLRKQLERHGMPRIILASVAEIVIKLNFSSDLP